MKGSDGLAKEKWAGMGGDALSTVSEAADRLSAAAEMESEDTDHLADVGESVRCVVKPFSLDHPANRVKAGAVSYTHLTLPTMAVV